MYVCVYISLSLYTYIYIYMYVSCQKPPRSQGFVIMIVAHALDQQRLWPGVEAVCIYIYIYVYIVTTILKYTIYIYTRIL